jgi:hypothetical protein
MVPEGRSITGVSEGTSVIGICSSPGSGSHFSTRHSKNTCPSEAKALSPFTVNHFTGMPWRSLPL